MRTGASASHNDNGSTYQATAQTSLTPLVPDFSNRFSAALQGMYDEPSKTGIPRYFQVDTNGQLIRDVQFLADDDQLERSRSAVPVPL